MLKELSSTSAFGGRDMHSRISRAKNKGIFRGERTHFVSLRFGLGEAGLSFRGARQGSHPGQFELFQKNFISLLKWVEPECFP